MHFIWLMPYFSYLSICGWMFRVVFRVLNATLCFFKEFCFFSTVCESGPFGLLMLWVSGFYVCFGWGVSYLGLYCIDYYVMCFFCY
jgi:hypothetical protein